MDESRNYDQTRFTNSKNRKPTPNNGSRSSIGNAPTADFARMGHYQIHQGLYHYMTTGSATQQKYAPVLSENKVPQGLRADRQNSKCERQSADVNLVPSRLETHSSTPKFFRLVLTAWPLLLPASPPTSRPPLRNTAPFVAVPLPGNAPDCAPSEIR